MDKKGSMEKILAIVGSTNPNSVNKKLVNYITGFFEDSDVKLQDWTHFDVPVYTYELEKERGFPVDIRIFKNTLDQYEALILAVTEHNMSIPGFLKNIFDWLSQMDSKFLNGKKVLLMSTSEDEKGSIHALEYMKKLLPSFGAEVIESFSLPYFSKNYDEQENTLKDQILLLGLKEVLTHFEQRIKLS